MTNYHALSANETNMEEPFRRSVLLVDDSPINLEILKGALEDFYVLHTAADGQEAIASARNNRPDLILLDIMMPDMNGYQVCKRLKEHPNTRRIPVIFITALTESENKTEGFEAGGVDYVVKPFDVEEIRARVKTHISLKLANEALERQKVLFQDLSQKISRYISPEVYSSIFQGKREAKIESERKKLTVFFSDIADFTGTTEKMQPEELSELLNNYLVEMTHIALSYGATIDKYIGDAIMAFFGDPESHGVINDAVACVKMALAMQSRIKSLQMKWRNHGIAKPFSVRMGINTGHCTVGNFGSDKLMMYTIIGGEVNIASRLQSAADPGEILISPETYALVKGEIRCEKAEITPLKGVPFPIQTYRVVDSKENLEGANKIIREESDGFSLYLDIDNMRESEKNDARRLLKAALDILEQNK